MIQVTKKQNEYLLQLSSGPKTTRDLMLSQMVTMESAGRMIKKLKKKGLIESTRKYGGRGNILNHRLATPYSELEKKGMIIKNRSEGTLVPDEEILYAAILRNAGLIGQRLTDQYQKKYSHRRPRAIKNVVIKARAEGLCR